MFAAEDFIAIDTTCAITAGVMSCLEIGAIAGGCAEIRGAAPVAATRGVTTLPKFVTEGSVLSSLGVISWSGGCKGDGGKGSNDDNEELHSVKKF